MCLGSCLFSICGAVLPNHRTNHCGLLFEVVSIQMGFVQNNFTPDCSLLRELYDRYAGIMFSVLLDICESAPAAERILVRCFETIQHGQYPLQADAVKLLSLLKLAVATARAHGPIKAVSCIHVFQQSPMLQQILFNDVCPDQFSMQYGLSRLEIARRIRAELSATSTVAGPVLASYRSTHFGVGLNRN